MSQLPLFQLPPVRLESPFEDILGRSFAELPESDRRERWNRWLTIASKSRKARDLVDVWTDTDACRGCKYLDGHWCSLQGLPCTVNPYLSFRTGIVGMACMGAGYEPLPLRPAVAQATPASLGELLGIADRSQP